MTDLKSQERISQYKETIADWWTKDCSFYDNYPEHGLTIKEEALWRTFFEEELGENPLKILDVGTGTGSISLILAYLGHDVTGIDLSPGMLDVCEKKAGARGLMLDLHVGDAETLPFPDQQFDVVTSRWVLWTLLQPETAISEWMRVLKPGGKIFAFDVKNPKYRDNTVPEKVKQFISRTLITVQDGRKPDGYSYRDDIRDALPLSYNHADAFERQVVLFRDSGLTDVLVQEVSPLARMKDEKLDKPWRYRFGWKGYGDWHCISGVKG